MRPLVYLKGAITTGRLHHFHQILDWKSMRLFLLRYQHNMQQYALQCLNVFIGHPEIKTFICRIKMFLIITLDWVICWGIGVWSTLFQWFSCYVYYKHNYSVLDHLRHETCLKAKTYYSWQLVTQPNDTQTKDNQHEGFQSNDNQSVSLNLFSFSKKIFSCQTGYL